ncbi:ESX secretion-associated protein EspG [Lentzea sp.]|uniref:ESX secretion-associated protein EspG n=1 Tax=Lentzea sp. TaxID=56099 RepID=UPI002ED28040
MRPIARLSLPAFDVLWEDVAAGSLPYPFDVDTHGETLDERERIRTQVYADLERQGLVERGRPEPHLEGALNLLAHNELRVIALCMPDTCQDELVRAGVVARGNHAVLFTQKSTEVTLNLVQPNEIATRLAGAMPENQPGPGQAVTVPAEAFEARKQDGFKQAVRDTESEDVRLAKQMLTGPATGHGHFLVQTDDSELPPVTWVDTRKGRYATVSARPGWFTVGPADNAGLARQLGRVLTTR